jgi:osmotically-inducible protein OsmY
MSEPASKDSLIQAEAHLQNRLRGRVCGVRVLFRQEGVILQGQAPNYHAKQLGQHIAMKELHLSVVANEIEVRPRLPFLLLGQLNATNQ